MTRQSELHNAALASAYDFSLCTTIVDVGGGQGATLAAVLRANPDARGILLDLPYVVADPAPLLAPTWQRAQPWSAVMRGRRYPPAETAT